MDSFIRSNRTHCALALFLLLYGIFAYISPNFAFKNKIPRPFGLGLHGSTVIPVWLVVIAIAALCYAATVRLSR